MIAEASGILNFFTVIKKLCKCAICNVLLSGTVPLMLDGMIGGYNIAEDLSGDPFFSHMCGFTSDELEFLVENTLCDEKSGVNHDDLLKRLKESSGAYRFYDDGAVVYDPSKCMRFLQQLKSGTPQNDVVETGQADTLMMLAKVLQHSLDRDEVEQIIQAVLNDETIPEDFGHYYFSISEAIKFRRGVLPYMLMSMGFLTRTDEFHYLKCTSTATKDLFAKVKDYLIF